MKQNERRVGPGTKGPFLHPRTPGGGARHADVRVVIHISDVLNPPAPSEPYRQPIPRPARGPRFRRWGVEQPGASYPFRVESDTPAPDASSAGEAWRAVVALAAGLTLAVLSYAQFRGGRGELPVYELTAVLAPDAPSETPGIEPALDTADVVDVVSAPSVQPRRAPVPRASVRAAALPLDAVAASGIPEAVQSRAIAAAIEAAPTPPASIDVDERADAPDAAPAAAAVTDPTPGDEDHIRAALTRWRTAYSALDARAAREVWPSVDMRALERAFHALRSQEVRFDRCDLTVNGGNALAACTGRAIYVPRVGRQSPRTTSREWTFELKKTDERWTIASARSS